MNKGSLRFERNAATFVLGEKSALRFIADDKIQVLSGSLWIEEAKDLAVVVHPQFGFSASGSLFLQKTADGNIFVRNLEADIKFRSPFVFKGEALPAGFQNWYGRLNAQKQIDRGIFRPIEFASFLKAWLPMTHLSIAEAKGRVLVWKEQWSGALEASAHFYQEVVERRMASVELQDQQRAARQKAAQTEQNRIRQLYRQKTGFEQ